MVQLFDYLAVIQRIIFDISDKVMGVNVYKVFNKRSKKKFLKIDGLVKYYGGQDFCKLFDY